MTADIDDGPPELGTLAEPAQLTTMRQNPQLAERWREAVAARNSELKTSYRFPSPHEVGRDLIKLRELPPMPWPAAWPQMARRCRTYPGDVVGIVGSIGGGKTSFAIQMVLATMAAGLPGLWAALELGEEQVLSRIIANMHGVHAASVRDTWPEQRIVAASSSFVDMWRFVDRVQSGSPLEAQLRCIEAAIDLAWKIYGLPPVMVVDHLHKMVAAERDETAALRAAAGALEAIAQRKHAPSYIILLAQSSVSNQQVLTGRVEKQAAADMLGLESGGKAVADAAANAIALAVFKEDDAITLDAHGNVAKSRHSGGEGRVGLRFSKPGGVWHELDYLPATPAAVNADIEAKKKDRHRAGGEPTVTESRGELNTIRATTAAGMRKQVIREALARHGVLGMETVEIRRVPGAGRGAVIQQALQELERAGDAERIGSRWRLIPRGY